MGGVIQLFTENPYFAWIVDGLQYFVCILICWS
jgi:hypothetical protein